MDFQSLPRKDLQTLCKKNMIPANVTNVAMAEALAALQEVAGIEEFLNPIESESKQSEERIDNGSPGNCRTACRTSTRRKPVKEEPPTTQSIIRSRRGRVGEMADQENKDLNISSTPSLPSNRRRAPVPSARKKLETHLIEGNEKKKDQKNGHQKRSDVLETPSMPKTQKKVSVLSSTRRKTDVRMDSSVQGACSTRRSMRLLEKNMEKLSLMECGSVEPVVADKLFEELPERKEFCEQKINEIDSKLNVFAIGGNAFEEDDSKAALQLGIDESDDPEGVNEKKDKEEDQANDGKDCKESKEKVQMEDENEEDNTITDKEPQDKIQSEAATKDQCDPEDKIQSEAAIKEQHGFTPSCNNEFSTENFSKEKVLSAQSPLLQEKADLDITVQREVLKENSEIISEKTVDFNIEDLVDINVEEVEFQYVNAQDSVSEPKMEIQVVSDGESSFKEMVEFDIGELIDVDVMESELDISVQREVLKENSEIISEKTVDFNIEDLVDTNVEEVEFQYVNAQDSISEPKMEVQVVSDGESSFKEMVEFDIGELIDVDVMESELVENSIQETCKDSFPELRIEDLGKSDEILVHQQLPHEEDSEEIDNFSFTPFAVDQIPGQFPRPTAEVLVQESRIEIFDSADQDEDIKNNSNEDEERNLLSLRQLRKMVKELHLSKKSNKEKTYGKEQVEKVVRTALQPLSENCLTKDGQEKTTIANSMFIQ